MYLSAVADLLFAGCCRIGWLIGICRRGCVVDIMPHCHCSCLTLRACFLPCVARCPAASASLPLRRLLLLVLELAAAAVAPLDEHLLRIRSLLRGLARANLALALLPEQTRVEQAVAAAVSARTVTVPALAASASKYTPVTMARQQRRPLPRLSSSRSAAAQQQAKRRQHQPGAMAA